jgi:hypothetical protein
MWARVGRGKVVETECELKQHKPQFSNKCWTLVNPRKQAKLKWGKFHAKYMQIVWRIQDLKPKTSLEMFAHCNNPGAFVLLFLLDFQFLNVDFSGGARGEGKASSRAPEGHSWKCAEHKLWLTSLFNFYPKYSSLWQIFTEYAVDARRNACTSSYEASVGVVRFWTRLRNIPRFGISWKSDQWFLSSCRWTCMAKLTELSSESFLWSSGRLVPTFRRNILPPSSV